MNFPFGKSRLASTHRHRLVVMGDSLAQGFQNGGIFRTDLSFPHFLAESLGKDTTFDTPSFIAQGGIPLNLEALVRGIEERYGPEISWSESLGVSRELFTTLKRIKRYWEGRYRPLKIPRETPWHLQAVWGYAISDSWMMTEKRAAEFIRTQRNNYSVFSVLPDHAMYTTSRIVLNPTFDGPGSSNSMLDNVEWFSEHGGIENLICCLGHNNVIGAASDLKIRYSEDSDLSAFFANRACTVYRPEHFKKELIVLYEKLASLKSKRVFVPTLPLVSITPIMRGVNLDGSLPRGGYFDYYTRFWIWDDDFNPEIHPRLTRSQVIELDEITRVYNAEIAKQADRFGFHLVPVSQYVEAIATRRNGIRASEYSKLRSLFPTGLKRELAKRETTRHLPQDYPVGTDFYRLDPISGHLTKGGIFSLDGLHPTTIGYGLIAQIYYRTMQQAGVTFESELNWERIVSEDSLITNPPRILINLRDALQYMALDRNELLTRLGKGLLEEFMELVNPGARTLGMNPSDKHPSPQSESIS